MNPPPHGTKHCHRQVPACRGLMKLNFSSVYGPEDGVQGDEPHSSAEAFGEPTGTNRPRLGIANVCPTAQCDHELMTDTLRAGPHGLPFLNSCTFTVPPIVPWTWLPQLLRSGVQPSQPSIVTFNFTFSGT